MMIRSQLSNFTVGRILLT